jgi:hypothetical protein
MVGRTPRKWCIALYSVDFDKFELGKHIGVGLEKVGFESITFERDAYKEQFSQRIRNSCYAGLLKSDFVVIVVDRRCCYAPTGNVSESVICQVYRNARMLGKCVIPCIHSAAWREYEELSSAVQQESNLNSTESVRERVRPRHVENWAVIDFIDEVHRSDPDRFVIQFDGPRDIFEALERRLSSLTPRICHTLVRAQVEALMPSKTDCCSLVLEDLVEKGYFTEPRFRILKGRVLAGQSATQICNLTNSNKQVVVVGDAGVGKRTLLLYSFIQHANSCLERKSNRIPLYVFLSKQGSDADFKFSNLLEECCHRYLGKELYPLFNRNFIRPVFYIDVCDGSAHVGDLSSLCSSPFIMKLRSDQYEILGRVVRGNGCNPLILELLHWDETRVDLFLEHYCILRQRPEWYESIINLRVEPNGIDMVCTNPLHAMMLLWLLEEADSSAFCIPMDTASLYDAYIRCWVLSSAGEFRRSDSVIEDDCAERMLKGWQIAAWLIIEKRLKGEEIEKIQLKQCLLERDAGLRDVLDKAIFWGCVVTEPFKGAVQAIFHESVTEYLLALEIVASCKEERYSFLHNHVWTGNKEVESILQMLLAHETEYDREKILLNLRKAQTATQHLARESESCVQQPDACLADRGP